MIFLETKLKGAYILDPERREDSRGFFARMFCVDEFKKYNLETTFFQSNMSSTNRKHTLRGMHYQTNGSEEVKLVRCTSGALLDVIIDLREDASTFGQHMMVELSQDNAKQLYIPKGFAHGFLTLTDHTEIAYQVSAKYSPGNEKTIRWNGPFFRIKWPVNSPILSEKDAHAEDYKDNRR